VFYKSLHFIICNTRYVNDKWTELPMAHVNDTVQEQLSSEWKRLPLPAAGGKGVARVRGKINNILLVCPCVFSTGTIRYLHGTQMFRFITLSLVHFHSLLHSTFVSNFLLVQSRSLPFRPSVGFRALCYLLWRKKKKNIDFTALTKRFTQYYLWARKVWLSGCSINELIDFNAWL